MIAGGLIMSLTVAGAILAVAQGNIVRAIFGLATALVGVALAFLALGSPFVAAMEVLIYIGGITVAMVFAVMLSSAGQKEPACGPLRRVTSAVIAAAFFAAITWIITQTDFAPAIATRPELPEEAWSVQEIGRDLLDHFNVVFELLSVVLLLAIIGAITIARRDSDAEAGAEQENGA